MDVKTAIRNGDADTLRRLLIEDSSWANALVHWGENDCFLWHPLHYISDMLFEGTLQKGKDLARGEALILAGADLVFNRNRVDGRKSATPLIRAASLAAEEVGVSLVDEVAAAERRARFG